MTELDGDAANARRVKRTLKLSALGFGIVFFAGIGFGLSKASLEKHGSIDLMAGIILAVVALLALLLAWAALRILNTPTGEAPPTRKEKLNRNILLACGAMGFISAFVLMLAQDGSDLTRGLLSNEPLSPVVAIVMLVLLGVVLPILSFVWHRSAVDEQEVDAYKTGALWGINIFMMGAPIWWIAWRGGFLPAPDFMILYFATVFVVGAVWMWKKYR